MLMAACASSPIVVGVDGSPSSKCAVRWAAETAAHHGDPLLLVAAATIPVAYGAFGMPQSFFDDQHLEGNRRLHEADRIAHEAAPDGLSVTSELATGRAIETLLELSRTARLVVLGSRGLGEFSGGVLGSVTSALAHHAHSSVAVIRQWPRHKDPTAQGAVVVGVDGSAFSEPAVAAAFDEASLRGADLIVLHAWTDVTLSTVSPLEQGLPWASIETEEQARLTESLSAWRQQFPDVGVRTVIVQDRPLRHLQSYADTAQLLVVGSRGRGGFTDMLLGSTSTALLYTAQCPLLIVRSPH